MILMLLTEQAINKLVLAVQTKEPVTGLTHSFYNYPARFSPHFAREIIKAFTKPGDLVYDPFMGGGTTLVEASALGRRAVGNDINSLAVFIAQAKTTLLSAAEIAEINNWTLTLPPKLNLHHPPVRAIEWAELGYQRNINTKTTWRIRKLIELALSHILELPTEKQQRFARCSLLKTAQWALDCRKEVPIVSSFRNQLIRNINIMIESVEQYATIIEERYGGSVPPCVCFCGSTDGIENSSQWDGLTSPSLILTSPPYPGVHVVYHRWQIHGRKETPAPFWIANSLDGNGGAYYTFGDRRQKHLTGYFEQTEANFASLAKVCNENTWIVQLIAFSDPTWQLDRYLTVMDDVGLTEIRLDQLANSPDGRIWRDVPNRKWYAEQKGYTNSSKEVVLFHRLKHAP